jgi:hypothetical protein
MNGGIGFCIGLSLGTTLLSLSLAAERKRTRRALSTMVNRGQLRVQTRDGQAVDGEQLVMALDTALQDPDLETAGRDRKLAAIVAFLCVAIFTATVWVVIDRRF